MKITEYFQSLFESDPWMRSKRILVGPLSSRELVKEVFLERAPVIPGHVTSSFAEIAGDVLGSSQLLLKGRLSSASRTDALMLLSRDPTFQRICPRLSATDF